MNKFRKRGGHILTAVLYVVIYTVMQTVVSLIYAIYQQKLTNISDADIYENMINGSYAMTAIAAVLSMWIYMILGAVRKKPPARYVHSEKVYPMTAVMACISAIGARLAVTAYSHFAQKIGVLKRSLDSAMEYAPDELNAAQALAAFFMIIAIAPLFEEFLFRCLVMGELAEVMRPQSAIVFQAIIFGAAHMVLFQSIFAFVMGILLGIIYYKTRSIILSAACHAVFNFSAVAEALPLSNSSAAILAVFGILLIAASMTYIIRDSKKL